MGKLTPGWLATWSLEDKEEQSWFKVPVGQGLVVRVTGVTGLEGWLHREDWCRVLKSRFLVLKAIGSFSRRFTSFIRGPGPLSYPLAVFFSGWAGTIPDRERKSFRLQVRVSASGSHGLDRSLYVVLGTGSTPSVQVTRVRRAAYVMRRTDPTSSVQVQRMRGGAVYVVPRTNSTSSVQAGRMWRGSLRRAQDRLHIQCSGWRDVEGAVHVVPRTNSTPSVQ